ncbi:MAG TPA: glycosyltransferase family 4 protein [Gammaproteobacteria bacterium]|nr:glycosyltransferase family 4 protein [Gammaproteobacteria bacterium]
MRRLKILTWHTHGSYLYYLTRAPHDFYVLCKPGRPPGYAGRCGHLPWGDNVHDLPVEAAKRQQFDCVVFQDDAQYLADQHEILSSEQRRVPRIYLEHDPPRDHPTDTVHPADADDVLVVHVTPFNALMWAHRRSAIRVIEHGVVAPEGVVYSGELERGIVAVNHLGRRGRRLGQDVFERARQSVPLDLVGMGAEESGGLGEIRHDRLFEFAARYRFFFNPIRYTSLGLAVIEAMMVGLPIVGLATTEMATAIANGVTGYVDTSVDRLVERMQGLLGDRGEAARLGRNARRYARERFDIRRFVADWNAAFAAVTS